MKKIIILLFIFLSCLLSACTSGEGIEVKEWEVLLSEVTDPAAAAGSEGWQKQEMPAMFLHPRGGERRYHYLWLRGQADITGDPADYQGISLGRLYYIDTTFINNINVGSHDVNAYGNGHFPRNYTIPPGVLKKGTNTVLIRLGIYGKEYGGLSRHVLLMKSSPFKTRSITDDIIFRKIPFGIIIFLLGQVIFNLIFLIRKINIRINSYSALVCLSFIFYIMLLFAPWGFPGSDMRITLLWSCTAFVPIFFLKLIQSFYRVDLTSLNRVAIPLFIVAFLSIIINPDTTSPWFLGRISGGIILFLAGILLFYAIYQANRINPQKIAYVFVFFGVFPGLFIGWDILNYLFIFHYPPLTHTYTLPLFIVGMMVLIVDETIKNQITVEKLYRELKIYTAQTRDTVITATTEEKLSRVQEFLRENYRSDISREGLADAMDMSPDHMSRMFKAHTGKKISDFINELRIKEAAQSLIETDERITDIAFNVGFESLATFNRVFLKIAGSSPSRYRKEKKET